VCAALLVAVVIALGAYVWRSGYTRYITDDFCTASALNQRGFLGAMKFHRQTWSGRYSYYAAKAIPESIGPGTARFVPGLVLVLWCASAVWTFRRIAASPPPLLAILSGMAVVFASIDGTPEVLSVGGPLVWETGVITYMLPLVLYTLWAGLFFGSGSILGRSVASAVLMLAAGGLSETSLAAQGAMAAGVFVLTLLLRRSDLTRIAAAGLVSTLMALLLVASAPGNAVRMLRLPAQPPLPSAIADSFAMAYNYVGSIAFSDGASLLLILFCGIAVGLTSARFDLRAALLAAGVACGAYVATFVPSAWMLGMGPPPRALHVTNFFMIAMLFPLAVALGAAKPRAMRIAAPILAALSLVAAVHSTLVTARTMHQGQAGAAEMERIDAIMRAHPRENVVIHSPWAISNRILVAEPEFWTNRCMCAFYGVRTLRITR
jgi:hypothetical protein